MWNATAVSFRTDVERRSAVVLVFLRSLPRPVPGLLVLGLLAAGLLAPGIAGVAALAVVALVLAWLTYLSWPAVPATGRAVRLLVLCLVVGYLLARAAG